MGGLSIWRGWNRSRERVEKVEKERKRGGGDHLKETDWKQRNGLGKGEREMKREGWVHEENGLETEKGIWKGVKGNEEGGMIACRE